MHTQSKKNKCTISQFLTSNGPLIDNACCEILRILQKKDEMNLNNIACSNVQVKTTGESAYLHKSYAK
jgi:sulfatase maturation enzyme AslB (radical SAM superfamily)